MFEGSNLKNFFLGGTKHRELYETKTDWKRVTKLWTRSPLGKVGPYELAQGLVQKVISRSERRPPALLVEALEKIADELLRAEFLGDVEPLWDIIEHNVEAAVGFRAVMAQRKLWASDFDRVYSVVERLLGAIFSELLHALPDGCFGEDGAAGDTFDVPLVDLINDPASLIEQSLVFAYDPHAVSLGLFQELRQRYEYQLLIASGLSPTDDINERQRKLILPTKQKDKSAAELAALYLSGTPLQQLMDFPVPFHVPEGIRFEHCHIVGGTGHGKTQLMQKLIHADLVAAVHEKRSVVVIDSQGDLINKISRLDLFAPTRLGDRLVIIDPSDIEHPASLNLFDAHLDRLRSYGPADRERVLNGVIELYELFFGAFLGAELTQKQGVIFRYLARLMLAIPKSTIHTLMEIMEEGDKFRGYMRKLEGSAKYFFEKEFFHPSFAATKRQILKRLWGVLSTPAFERMLAQPTNKLDLFEALNDGKIILISTAKDLLKREGSELFGRFFIAMIVQAALERSILPENKRTPAFVYVDEAHEYFDDSIETILNQARKYKVGITLAHQTLDQLSPRLRSTILANTSMKCVGGVSAKDAQVLADELHATPDFLKSMRRTGARTEFAVWVKQLTPSAIRLSVPLGFLERQSTLADYEYDALIAGNRARYCGSAESASVLVAEAVGGAVGPVVAATVSAPADALRPTNIIVDGSDGIPLDLPIERGIQQREPLRSKLPLEERELGKGGPKHRYLQSLVKELAESQGLKATIEAPLKGGGGQVDVVIEGEDVLAAIEISVTTPVEHECDNLRKCLVAGYSKIAVVLSKSKAAQASYRRALFDVIAEPDRTRVTFLTPEEIPDYIATLIQPGAPAERTVKGYRVKSTVTQTSLDGTRERKDAVARLIAKSLANQKQD